MCIEAPPYTFSNGRTIVQKYRHPLLKKGLTMRLDQNNLATLIMMLMPDGREIAESQVLRAQSQN